MKLIIIAAILFVSYAQLQQNITPAHPADSQPHQTKDFEQGEAEEIKQDSNTHLKQQPDTPIEQQTLLKQGDNLHKNESPSNMSDEAFFFISYAVVMCLVLAVIFSVSKCLQRSRKVKRIASLAFADNFGSAKQETLDISYENKREAMGPAQE